MWNKKLHNGCLITIYLIGQKFVGHNISSDKIFENKPKFSRTSQNFDNFVWFLPDLCIEIMDKIFNGQNFRHQAEISTNLSNLFLSDKVLQYHPLYKNDLPFWTLKESNDLLDSSKQVSIVDQEKRAFLITLRWFSKL